MSHEPVKSLRPVVLLALGLVGLLVVGLALLVGERPPPPTMWLCVDVELDEDLPPSPLRPGEPDPSLLTMWVDVPEFVDAPPDAMPTWAAVERFGVTPRPTFSFRERYWLYHVTGEVHVDEAGRLWAEGRFVREETRVEDLVR